MNTNTNITVFANGENKVTTNKSGSTTTTFISRKAYGEMHGLKGSALKKAHLQYRLDRGINAGTNVTAAIAARQIVIETMRVNANGNRFTFTAIPAHKLDAENTVLDTVQKHNAAMKAELLKMGVPAEVIANLGK